MTHGRIAAEAVEARDRLAEEGIPVSILLCEYLKPYARLAEEVAAHLPAGVPVLFLEEEIRAGGFGMMLADALSRRGAMEGRSYAILATDDHFVIQSRPEPIFRTAEVDACAVIRQIRALAKR